MYLLVPVLPCRVPTTAAPPPLHGAYTDPWARGLKKEARDNRASATTARLLYLSQPHICFRPSQRHGPHSRSDAVIHRYCCCRRRPTRPRDFPFDQLTAPARNPHLVMGVSTTIFLDKLGGSWSPPGWPRSQLFFACQFITPYLSDRSRSRSRRRCCTPGAQCCRLRLGLTVRGTM